MKEFLPQFFCLKVTAYEIREIFTGKDCLFSRYVDFDVRLEKDFKPYMMWSEKTVIRLHVCPIFYWASYTLLWVLICPAKIPHYFCSML